MVRAEDAERARVLLEGLVAGDSPEPDEIA
jgi:hypothetical protein